MATTKKTRSTSNSASKKKTAAPEKPRGNAAYIAAAVSIVAGLLTLIFIYIDSGGLINAAVKSFIKGLFGFSAYFVPFCMILCPIYLFKTKKTASYALKSVLLFFVLVILSALIHLGGEDIIPIEYAYKSAMYSEGGGLLGALIAVPLYTLLNKAASYIILIALEIALVVLILGRSVITAVYSFMCGASGAIREEYQSSPKIDAYERGRRAVQNRPRLPRKETAALDVATDFAEELKPPEQNRLEEQSEVRADNQNADRFADIMPAVGKKKKRTRKKTGSGDLFDAEEFDESKRRNEQIENAIKGGKSASVEANAEAPAETDGDDQEFTEEITGDGIAEVFGGMGFDPTEEVTPDYFDDDSVMPAKSRLESVVSQEPPEGMTKKEMKAEAKRREQLDEDDLHRTIDEAAAEPVLEYVFPSTDILNEPEEISTDLRREMFETSKKLISVLADFNVQAKLSQVTQGPTVTRYEIQPSSGIKLSKIVGLANDIALNLAVPTVLVAPVPGKAAVGIEIPNKQVGAVSIKEMLDSEEFKNAKSRLAIALGKDIGGRVVIGDIAKMPHLLIAGATGSGKSVCINTIIVSILYNASPNDVKLIMVDPKVVELSVYNGIPHLLIPVVTDPKKAAGALNWAVGEMMRRYDLFAESSVRNLTGYNSLMEKTGGEKLPQIVIIIDELADLMMVAAKEVEDYVCRLAQLARAAGIYLIIATQRPSVDVITGLIKANIPSRIAFAVSSQVDSRTILDRAGAEKLLGRGDMLYYPAGMRDPQRVQGALVTDAEIESIVDFLKETGEENHYSEDLAEHIERMGGVAPDERDDDGDELLPDAIRVAVDLGQISTAMIQRKLKVGYSRAGRIIDQMEARGIISGANGSKPRQVYMSRAELASIDSEAQDNN